jgi:hypothetical protein
VFDGRAQMRAVVVVGFIVAELLQVGVWFAAAFYEVEYGRALSYWSLLGLGIFLVPIGFFASFSGQLRMAAVIAAALIIGAMVAVVAAIAAGALTNILEVIAPFIPGLILLGCIGGMKSHRRPVPTGSAN